MSSLTGRLAVTLSAVVMAVAACGSSDNSGSTAVATPSASDSSAVPSEPATSSARQMTLKEICPQVEAALPSGMLPSAPELQSFVATLQTLHGQGDLEAQNAVPLLLVPSEAFYKVIAAGTTGQPLVEASIAFNDGISAFAVRCKAAGSSALQ